MADRFATEGQTVYPGEIERALIDHPAMADAGAVGVPGKGRRKVGVVFVMLAEGAGATEQELLEFCRQSL